MQYFPSDVHAVLWVMPTRIAGAWVCEVDHHIRQRGRGWVCRCHAWIHVCSGLGVCRDSKVVIALVHCLFAQLGQQHGQRSTGFLFYLVT